MSGDKKTRSGERVFKRETEAPWAPERRQRISSMARERLISRVILR